MRIFDRDEYCDVLDGKQKCEEVTFRSFEYMNIKQSFSKFSLDFSYVQDNRHVKLHNAVDY